LILAHRIESRVRVEMRHHLTHARLLAPTRTHTHNIAVVVVAATHTQAYDRTLLVVSTMQHIQLSCRRTLRRTRATLRRSHMIGWAHESTNDTDGRRGRGRTRLTAHSKCTRVLVHLGPCRSRCRAWQLLSTRAPRYCCSFRTRRYPTRSNRK